MCRGVSHSLRFNLQIHTVGERRTSCWVGGLYLMKLLFGKRGTELLDDL